MEEERMGKGGKQFAFDHICFLNLTTIQRCNSLVLLVICVRQASDFFYELELVTRNSFLTKLLLYKW